MKQQPTCADCGLTAPSTNTAFTLISTQFGWRLSRRLVNDAFVTDWRCPDCWRAMKAKEALAADARAQRSGPSLPPSAIPGRRPSTTRVRVDSVVPSAHAAREKSPSEQPSSPPNAPRR